MLRGELAFQGLVVTDSLSTPALQAVGYSVPRAAVAALHAGADMVLFNADASSVASVTTQIVAAITSAVRRGALARNTVEGAVAHVLATKHVDLCAPA